MSIFTRIIILLDISKRYGKKLTKAQEKVAWKLYQMHYGIDAICKYL